MNTAKELATTSLFADLASDDLALFAGLAREVQFSPEEKVYSAGTAGDSFFVIIAGRFRVQVTDENKDEVVVATLKAGSYFGEMEVIGGLNRTADVIAEQESRCYRFDSAAVLSTLKGNDHLAAHFYRHICRELIRRLQSTTRDMGYFKSRAT